MLVTSMTCPMCRAGTNGKLLLNCIPQHIRAPMRKKSAAITLEAHLAQVEQDQAMAYEMVSDLLHTGGANGLLSTTFDHAIDELCIKISVYFYTSRSISEYPMPSSPQPTHTSAEQLRHVYTHEYTMETSNNVFYSTKPADVQHIVECVNTLPIVGMRFTVHTLSMTNHPVKLSSTELFEIRELAGWDILTLSGMEGMGHTPPAIDSSFAITRTRHSERIQPAHHRAPPGCTTPISLAAIEWNSQAHILHRLLATPLEWMPNDVL